MISWYHSVAMHASCAGRRRRDKETSAGSSSPRLLMGGVVTLSCQVIGREKGEKPPKSCRRRRLSLSLWWPVVGPPPFIMVSTGALCRRWHHHQGSPGGGVVDRPVGSAVSWSLSPLSLPSWVSLSVMSSGAFSSSALSSAPPVPVGGLTVPPAGICRRTSAFHTFASALILRAAQDTHLVLQPRRYRGGRMTASHSCPTVWRRVNAASACASGTPPPGGVYVVRAVAECGNARMHRVATHRRWMESAGHGCGRSARAPRTRCAAARMAGNRCCVGSHPGSFIVTW